MRLKSAPRFLCLYKQKNSDLQATICTIRHNAQPAMISTCCAIPQVNHGVKFGTLLARLKRARREVDALCFN